MLAQNTQLISHANLVSTKHRLRAVRLARYLFLDWGTFVMAILPLCTCFRGVALKGLLKEGDRIFLLTKKKSKFSLLLLVYAILPAPTLITPALSCYENPKCIVLLAALLNDWLHLCSYILDLLQVAWQGFCHQSNTSTQVETMSQFRPLKSKVESRM